MRTVGSWALETPIGSGSFALVWKAVHVQSGTVAAVKEINTDKLNRKLQESLASEISVLEQTKHDNIIRLLDLIKVGCAKPHLTRKHANASQRRPRINSGVTLTNTQINPRTGLSRAAHFFGNTPITTTDDVFMVQKSATG